MPSGLDYIEGHKGSCVMGQGEAHVRRGVRPEHARRGRPSNLAEEVQLDALLKEHHRQVAEFGKLVKSLGAKDLVLPDFIRC